jgi:hypothetical protein
MATHDVAETVLVQHLLCCRPFETLAALAPQGEVPL